MRLSQNRLASIGSLLLIAAAALMCSSDVLLRADTPADETGAEEIDGADHWSFQPPAPSTPPSVQNAGRIDNPIDAFVLATLEKKRIVPSPAADRSTLIRRLSLDLLGLPPSPDEVKAFVYDRRPDAYAQLVERMLASPHFGERWGRHWLDLARYADTNGYEADGFRPNAWRYRSWVIDAINADMPFDQFTVEQLAGDLLPHPTRDQLIATGFHRQTLINTEGGVDQEEFRVKANLDRVVTTGTVWLGMTMLCTQCHDHKYDPIVMTDFYQLFAFFNNADDAVHNFPASGPAADAFHKKLKLHREELAKLEKQIADARKEMADPTGRLNKLINVWMRKERQTPRSPTGAALVMRERTVPRTTHVLLRGDFMQLGDEVAPGTLRVLHWFKPKRKQPNRLDLAHWLIDPANPLTARVSVNRIWRHLFGRGLVASIDNFGVMGEEPSHPELLDWLAVEYIKRGWSRKAMIRTIVTSATYRQSSRVRKDLAESDPENSLLARQSRFRVEAEIVRDLYLSVGGMLHPTLGGPGIRPLLPPSVAEVSYASKVKWRTSPKPERYRRGVYIIFQRTVPYPSLMTFDCPESVLTAAGRNLSNTPLQSLTLLNDPVFFECTQAMGRRVLENGPPDNRGRLQYAARLALARELTESELARFEDLIKRQTERFQSDIEAADKYVGRQPAHVNTGTSSGSDATVQTAAWISVCSVLMNLDEFLTRE